VSTFIRKVKTKSGATAVQLVTKHGQNVVKILHFGSAHSQEQLDQLLTLARAKKHEHQLSLFPQTQPQTITLTKTYSTLLWDCLAAVYSRLGFTVLQDTVFEQLVLSRIIEPTSKLDTIRVLDDFDVSLPSESGIHRTLKRCIVKSYRSRITDLCFEACDHHNLSLLLYDVTTLYFEIQAGDGFREGGLSKERKLEPQIVVGLLVDHTGFPLSIHEFEGNLAETKTIIPVLTAFRKQHAGKLGRIIVTADAGMLSAANLQALENAGFDFIVGSRLAKTPYEIKIYQSSPEQPAFSDGQIFETVQSFGYKTTDKVRRRVIYQYKHKRAVLDLRNIEKQVSKAKRIVSGKAPLKKSTFVSIGKTAPKLNYQLVEEHKLRAGIKGYVTSLASPAQDHIDGVSALDIITAYHQLFQVEKSFRMSKSDLKARPIFHHQLDSIRAHLTIVFAALAIARVIEAKTHLSIKRFVQMLKVIRSGLITINGKQYEAAPAIPEQVKIIVEKLKTN